MAMPDDRDPSMFVHEQGNQSLDGIFRLIEVAGQHQPLDDVLAAMCAGVASTAGADVVSIYVREDSDEGEVFTMRGNVGFPDEAVGRVHLRAGEGIIGFVAERLRPVSVATAASDEHFKYIPGLGEERFPAMLAVPVLRGSSAAGVLVLQRGLTRVFTSEEVVLATALAAVISHAFERAADHEREQSRRAERGVARLRGVTLSSGTAMGRAEVLPTLASLARSAPLPAGGGGGGGGGGTSLPFESVARRLRADLDRAAHNATPAPAREIASLGLILDDHRFCERLALASVASAPLKALSELARDYARVSLQTNWGDGGTADLMTGRAAEIEDLCVLAHAALSGRPLVRSGAIVLAEQLRTFQALSAIARGASAFVVEGDLEEEGTVAKIVRAAGLPLLKLVTGIFSWVHPDDLLVVDADAAHVRINPGATAVARFRSGRA
ncbi:MAG TPA: GAF domain-containing protein [Polyangia bacterium]|jgi:phosphotransferase system enzyme I (PtsP)|nr:GAF domain-containing protein [Polyangia bacterium]